MPTFKHIVRPLLLATLCTCTGPVAFAQSAGDAFAPYITCSLPNGPSVTESAPLAPGLRERTVKTRRGNATISLVDGRTITFAYPNEAAYAHVTVETVLAGNYAQARSTLIDNFEDTLSSGENIRNEKLKSRLNGFAVQGFDRLKREGDVLGLYLLLDDATHTAITIDFLNVDHFKTMEEYATLRDRFLDAYTACIRDKQ